MREPISLKEILAALIRKGTFLLWMALILGILLGGYKFLQLRAEAGKPENAPEKIEQRREAAQAEWQDKKEQLEKELEKAKKDLELQEEYCENSILMQVNPYDTAKCTIIVSITGLEIPPEEVAILLINGFHKKPVDPVKDGDVVALFPPVGGG